MTHADVPLLLTIGVLGVWALVYELHTRRIQMARRKSTDYKVEATRELFELELETGDVVTFRDPNKLETESVWHSDPSLEAWYKTMLSERDHEKWWNEYKAKPQEETVALQADVMAHFRS